MDPFTICPEVTQVFIGRKSFEEFWEQEDFYRSRWHCYVIDSSVALSIVAFHVLLSLVFLKLIWFLAVAILKELSKYEGSREDHFSDKFVKQLDMCLSLNQILNDSSTSNHPKCGFRHIYDINSATDKLGRRETSLGHTRPCSMVGDEQEPVYVYSVANSTKGEFSQAESMNRTDFPDFGELISVISPGNFWKDDRPLVFKFMNRNHSYGPMTSNTTL